MLLKPRIRSRDSWRGVFIACCILAIWAVSLGVLLTVPFSELNPLTIGSAVAWQTFLYTGLFITAHDAMHGVVAPNHPRLNHWIGSLALTVYGLFSFDSLLKKHWQHHHHPASSKDPDFHDGQHENFFAWYFHFMRSYWSWWRLAGLMIIYNVAKRWLGLPDANLTVFWALPSILSSVQLFYFGTYLPHREPEAGYPDELRAQSIYRPSIVSFLTCYHFGYHREHHEFPHVPWWQLPQVARQQLVRQQVPSAKAVQN